MEEGNEGEREGGRDEGRGWVGDIIEGQHGIADVAYIQIVYACLCACV